MLPITSDMNDVKTARTRYSAKCESRIRQLVAPNVFKITAC